MFTGISWPSFQQFICNTWKRIHVFSCTCLPGTSCFRHRFIRPMKWNARFRITFTVLKSFLLIFLLNFFFGPEKDLIPVRESAYDLWQLSLQAARNYFYQDRTIMHSYIYKVLTKSSVPHHLALLVDKKAAWNQLFENCLSLLHKWQSYYSCKVTMNYLHSSALNVVVYLWSIFLFLLAFSLFPPCLPLTLCVCQRWVSEKLSVESLRDLELFGGETHWNTTKGFNIPKPLLNVII